MISRAISHSLLVLCLLAVHGCQGGNSPTNNEITIFTSHSGVSWKLDTLVAGGGGELHGIWGASPSQVFVTGTRRDSAGERGIVWQYDGNHWQEFYSQSSVEFRGIFGLSSQSIWVAGVLQPNTWNGALVLHWNGQHWEESLSDPASPGLLKVWARNDHDVYAVGYTGAIFHLDGTVWMKDSIPIDPALRAAINDVWGGTSQDGGQEVYAATSYGGLQGLVLRKNKDLWETSFLSPNEGGRGEFRSVWIAPGEGTYALEEFGRGPIPTGSLFGRQGGGWKSMGLYRRNGLFTAVKGDPSGHIYVIGSDLYRFDGGSWSLFRDYPQYEFILLQDLWIADARVFMCANSDSTSFVITGDFSKAASR